MAKNVPNYLEGLVLEGGGDPEQVRTELAFCQIEATEAQTAVLERIASALERLAPVPYLPAGDDIIAHHKEISRTFTGQDS